MSLEQLAGRLCRVLLRPQRVRRVRGFWRYRTAQRQIARMTEEMRRGQDLLVSRPIYLVLEPGAVCNLRCPHCPTGARTGTLGRDLLNPETFQAITRHLPLDSLFEVCLFNWGEPFLNPHVLDYVAWFARRGIRVTIHTNFSARDYDDAFMENIVRSGLSHLVASVDGASQASYEKYRVGGDFDRVIGNLGRLAGARRRLGFDTPRVTYKMLLNRYNENEQQEARDIAASLGIEYASDECFFAPSEVRGQWLAEGVRERHGDEPLTSMKPDVPGVVTTECRQLWDTLVVNADGGVLPCCIAWSAEGVVGNLAREPFEDVWNSDRMRYLRRFVIDRNCAAPDFPNLCVRCDFRYCTYHRK